MLDEPHVLAGLTEHGKLLEDFLAAMVPDRERTHSWWNAGNDRHGDTRFTPSNEVHDESYTVYFQTEGGSRDEADWCVDTA